MFDVRKVHLGSKPYWFLTQDGVDVPYDQKDPSRKPAWKLKRDAAEIARKLNSGEDTLESLEPKKPNTEEQEIAKTIRSQLLTMELMALGATKLAALNRNEDRLGGLQFNASFFGKYACQVRIELDWSDTYRVLLLNMQGVQLRSTDMVYADVLTETVSTFVEEHFALAEKK